MSIWGTNNFERDDALNVLDELKRTIVEQIRDTFALNSTTTLYEDAGESQIVANIDILTTLLKHYRTYPFVELSEIAQWKREYLITFDRTIHAYEPAPNYAKKRREVVEETFSRFQKVVSEIYEE